MDFSKVKEIIIPEGLVVKITNSNNVVLWSANKIPSEYQEVEYIMADKDVKAYINLGFAFDTKARIEMGQYVYSDTTAYPFGAAENSGVYRCMISAPYSSVVSLYGSSGSAFNGVQTVGYVKNSVNEYDMILEKGNLSITNKTLGKSGKATNQASYTMTNKLYLFAQNYNGTPRFGAERRIHYFKYYDKNDVLICDLVPCYRKSDGVIGMYDIVRKQFLTNVGSGTFIKGADVGQSAPTIEDQLIDFTYTANADGTYTITGWKGTYKGVTSTECILPDNDKVSIDGGISVDTGAEVKPEPESSGPSGPSEPDEPDEPV